MTPSASPEETPGAGGVAVAGAGVQEHRARLLEQRDGALCRIGDPGEGARGAQRAAVLGEPRGGRRGEGRGEQGEHHEQPRHHAPYYVRRPGTSLTSVI
jgi:hypothetical protein